MALPPRPANICALAWEGVFAARFGFWHDAVELVGTVEGEPKRWTGGYAYSVSSVVWLECALSGCLWCRFLEKRFLEEIKSRYSDRPIPDETVDVRVGEVEGGCMIRCECSSERRKLVDLGWRDGEASECNKLLFRCSWLALVDLPCVTACHGQWTEQYVALLSRSSLSHSIVPEESARDARYSDLNQRQCHQ